MFGTIKVKLPILALNALRHRARHYGHSVEHEAVLAILFACNVHAADRGNAELTRRFAEEHVRYITDHNLKGYRVAERNAAQASSHLN